MEEPLTFNDRIKGVVVLCPLPPAHPGPLSGSLSGFPFQAVCFILYLPFHPGIWHLAGAL